MKVLFVFWTVFLGTYDEIYVFTVFHKVATAVGNSNLGKRFLKLQKILILLKILVLYSYISQKVA